MIHFDYEFTDSKLEQYGSPHFWILIDLRLSSTPFVASVAISCYEINHVRDYFLFWYLDLFSSCRDLVFQASLDLGDFDLIN